MQVTYGKGFEVERPMRDKVCALQAEMSKMPQYEPETKHHFHGGMYCREVMQHAGVLVVGKVHLKEHFFMVASGTVVVTIDNSIERVDGPCVLSSNPGAKRAIYAETDAIYMTFHRTDSLTVEDAENELVEYDENSMFGVGNIIKKPLIEV